METLLKGAGWLAELSDVEFICIDAPHAAAPELDLYDRLVDAGLCRGRRSSWKALRIEGRA